MTTSQVITAHNGGGGHVLSADLAALFDAVNANCKAADDAARNAIDYERTALERAFDAGLNLLAIKAQVKHGEFSQLLENYCSQWSPRRLRDYMRIADAKRQRAADLESATSIRQALEMIRPSRDDATQAVELKPTVSPVPRPAVIKPPVVANSAVTLPPAPAIDDDFDDDSGHAILLSQWAALSESQQREALNTPTTKRFHKQTNDSIGWAAYSWNPVSGCLASCKYCYAKRMAPLAYARHIPNPADRFKPALHPSSLLAPRNKQDNAPNNRVFTCSMADLFGDWMPHDVTDAVLREVELQPLFEFLFLTKYPDNLLQFNFPANAWIGATADCQARMDRAESAFAKMTDNNVHWVSIEPMLERIIPKHPELFDWFVIGGEQQNTVIPNCGDVLDLIHVIRAAGKRFYLKGNLLTMLPQLQQFPK